jgi:hypothetical protein
MSQSQYAIGTYLRLTTRTGGDVPNNAWQNFYHGGTRLIDGVSYTYAGFGFSGATLDVQAGALTAQLVFSLNNLDLSIFQTACDLRYLANVKTIWLDPETLTEQSDYYEEIMQVLGFSHNGSQLTVTIGSPDNAIDTTFPRLRLTARMVGQLPSQGSIPLV